MEKVAMPVAQIVEPNYSNASQPEQKSHEVDNLAALPVMRLQANRYDAFYDQLGKDGQEGEQ